MNVQMDDLLPVLDEKSLDKSKVVYLLLSYVYEPFRRITFWKDFLSEASPFFPQQSHSLFPLLLFPFPLPSQFLIHPSLSNPQTDPISPPPPLPLRKPHLSPLAPLSRRLPTSNVSNPTLRHGTRRHGPQFIDLFPAILDWHGMVTGMEIEGGSNGVIEKFY